jgi:hypothetical protein
MSELIYSGDITVLFYGVNFDKMFNLTI